MRREAARRPLQLLIAVITIALTSSIGIALAFANETNYALCAQSSLPTIQSDTRWYFTHQNPYYPSDQCVWYAWGRASEILGRPLSSQSLGNGCDFWGRVSQEFQRDTQQPRVGSIACAGGNTPYGHVAIVESVNANGSITVSEVWGSNHDGGQVHVMTYANGAAWAWGSGGHSNFQGYIYLDGGSSAANTPSAALPEGDGIYTIASSINPRFVLDVAGASHDDGANVQVYERNDTDAQRFAFRRNADGTYTITNQASGKALDVSAASQSDGANIQQWSSNGTDAQKWILVDCGDGTYSLVAKHSGKFLDVYGANASNCSNVWQCSGNGTAAQKFVISKSLGRRASMPQGDGVYTIATAANDNLVLDVCGASHDDGANVWIVGRNGTAAQQFCFTSNGDGTYCITNVGSGKVLDVAAASRQDGANVQQWSANGSYAQRWWVIDYGDGTYGLSAQTSDKYLDVYGASFIEGTNVHQWRPNGTAAQKWVFSIC